VFERVFNWLFRYPFSEFRYGTLIYLRDWPLYALLGIGLLGAIIIIAMAWRRRVLSLARTSTITGLQLAMWVLVLWVVWQPALLISSLRSGDNSIAVMLDASASMSVVDAADGDATTRMQQAQAVLKDASFNALGKDYQLKRYTFADNAGKIESFDELPRPITATHIGDSVLEVLNASRTTPLGAIVLLSDGSDNAGQLDAAQLAEIARFGVPIHVIGIGREQMPEDFELENVLAPSMTLPGSKVAARVAIRHDGAGIAHVRVTDGDKLLAANDITLSKDANLTTSWIDFNLNDTGYRELRFSIAQGPHERELRNNERTRLVNVQSEVAPVLYIEGEPRWDYKFMRRALEHDNSVRLVSLLRTTTNGIYRQGVDNPNELKDGFPRTREELFKYDALIVGNIQAAYFTHVQQQLIQDFVNLRGGNLLMLGGSNTLSDGGWMNTVVNDVLPVHLFDKGSSKGTSFHRAQAQVVLTPRGQRESWLKLADNELDNVKQWNSLPLLADYQDVGTLKPAASSLLSIKFENREQPLFVTQTYGRGHASTLATGGTWRWRMLLPLNDQRHEIFWRQLTHHLVSNVPQQNELTANSQADYIYVRAALRDKSYLPQRDANVSAVVTLPSGYTETLLLRPVADQPGLYAAEFEPQASGTFYIEMMARRGNEVIGTARTAVHHEHGAAEFFSLRQNRALLEQLAQATGGHYWTLATLAGLPEAIRYSPAGVKEQQTKPLWDMPINFLLLILLKTTEWILRRKWGAI